MQTKKDKFQECQKLMKKLAKLRDEENNLLAKLWELIKNE